MSGVPGAVSPEDTGPDELRKEIAGLESAIELQRRKLDDFEKRLPTNRWNFSILIPVLVALIGFVATVAATIVKWYADSELERDKLQSSIILKAIETGDALTSASNLLKFQEWKLVSLTEEQINELKTNPEETPFTAPPAAGPRPLRSAVEQQLAFEMTEAWAAQNIVEIDIPQLKGIPTPGGGTYSGKVKIHRLAAADLQAAFAEIEQKGLLDRLKEWGGSFTLKRTIRGTDIPSTHAMGIAFDLNVSTNPLGGPIRPPGSEGSLVELAPIFEAHGFVWGGTYQRPDPMHFEYLRFAAEAAAAAQ